MGFRALVTVVVLAACGHPSAVAGDAPGDHHDSGSSSDGSASSDASFPDTRDGNRDRLLATYLAFLQADPTKVQSNGLSGQNLTTVCDLWNALDPSSQDTFRTITDRLWGGKIVSDGTRMLEHILTLYRLSGGQAATATDPGSCGGGEYNRMIMSTDHQLHDLNVVVNSDDGNPIDIDDIPPDGYWRNSHDLGGPHSPFDLSDECNNGAPRGQTQFFTNPASTLANSPLGRLDLETLVDPYALEMDEDYNCPHDSNPDCSYTTYGDLCFPETSMEGIALYVQNYDDYGATWKPDGC
jgi:hypothetical protein